MRVRAQQGYSLLELTIALALIGFIAVAIAGGVRFGSRAWETSESKLDAVERVHGSQTLLRAVLQQAIPRALNPEVASDPLVFRGGPDRLSFAALLPSALGAGGVVRLELRVEAASEGRRLVLAWAGSDAVRQERVLLTGAQFVTLSYGTRDQDGSISWGSDWREQPGAPALVMVQASYGDGAELRWPDLVVRTRIAQDPQCQFDVDTFGCHYG
jgi:general secretion pathway protein J